MNGKTIAIVSYITIIGWVIALILNNNEKNSFASFHIRQSLGINLLGMALTFIPVIGWILGIAVFIFWVIGLIAAITERTVPVPVIGGLFQDWFKTL